MHTWEKLICIVWLNVHNHYVLESQQIAVVLETGIEYRMYFRVISNRSVCHKNSLNTRTACEMKSLFVILIRCLTSIMPKMTCVIAMLFMFTSGPTVNIIEYSYEYAASYSSESIIS